MKNILFVIAFLGASPALAQSGCGGQFAPNTFCGNTGVANAIPGPVSTSQLTTGQLSQPMIVNGEAIFDQRNEGDPYTCGAEVYGPDGHRFACGTPGVFTFSRVGGASAIPNSPDGFPYHLHVAVTTADTSQGQFDNYHLEIPIEDIRMRGLQEGTPTAQTFTFQVAMRCSITGLYSFSVLNGINTRSFVQTVNYTSANVWQKVFFTVPGDTDAVPGWNQPSSNRIGLKIITDLGWGWGFETSNLGVWQDNASFRAPGSVALIAHIGATCDYVAYQIDLGSVPLGYRFIPYETQLSLVQRYIRKSFPQGVQAKNLPTTGFAGAIGYIAQTDGRVTGYGVREVFPQEMFTTPVVTFYNPIGGTAGHWENFAGTDSGLPLALMLGTTGFVAYNPQVDADVKAQQYGVHYVAGACPGNSGAGTGC